MLSWLFPEAGDMGLGALLFMMTVYGYILCRASELISHGSELLLLLYGPGIVGMVLPILGAVPDVAVLGVVAFSNGSAAEIEAQVSIAIGAIVGSTIFILTLPWAAAIYLARRDYDSHTDAAAVTANNKPKLTQLSLMRNCVTLLQDTSLGAKIMIGVSLSYLIVQIPAYTFQNDRDGGMDRERPYLLFAIFLTFVAFVLYCLSSLLSASANDLDRRKQEQLRRDQWKSSLDSTFGREEMQEMIFRQHDKDRSGLLDAAELASALASLGLKVDRRAIGEIMTVMDVGHEADGGGAGDGKISLNEFKAAVSLWVSSGQTNEGLTKRIAKVEEAVADAPTSPSVPTDSTPLKIQRQPSVSVMKVNANPNDEADCEEAEEEHHWHLSDAQLNVQAAVLLCSGTLFVTVFTDPMVDCLASAGIQLNISPFYLAFLIIPVISNASELIAGLNFAQKKTNESISMTLNTFHGTAIINSTLCLFLFLCIVYTRRIVWNYTAEVAAVLTTILVVGVNALRKNIFLWQALLVACMYPISVCMVYVLENQFGLQ